MRRIRIMRDSRGFYFQEKHWFWGWQETWSNGEQDRLYFQSPKDIKDFINRKYREKFLYSHPDTIEEFEIT